MNQGDVPRAKGKRISSWILNELQPARLIPSLSASLVAGLLIIILSVSFAALIFSGGLKSFIPSGIGLILTTAVIGGLVISLTSSYPGTLGAPQDKVAPILGLMASTIAAGMPPGSTPEQTFLTVCAAIIFASLLTGITLGALGVFRLGAFIRFIPFPVIGGFLAGAGWLLVLGAIKTMTGRKVTIPDIALFFKPDYLFKWMAGLFFAILLLVVLKRFKHALTMPAVILIVIFVFYILLLVTHTSISDARESGWLLGNLPSGGVWEPISYRGLLDANWGLIFHNAGSLATVLLVSAIALLLNASAIELQSEHEMDLDHELRAAGVTNLACAAMGGMVSFHSLSVSSMIIKMGVRSRMVGIFAALICAGALFFGASAISYVPIPIIGGMLMFLGLSFLREWAIETWHKLPKTEYAVVLLILVVVGAIGYLQGVAVGLVAAVILFVVKYSRINVVKNALTGATYHSNVDRPKIHRKLLRENGEKMLILKLHGFIFFGTANTLLNHVRNRAADPTRPPLMYIVLDFHQVTGIDTSAALSMLKMSQLARKKNFQIIFTDLNDETRNQLEKGGLLGKEDKTAMVFPDLDYGVEWCENQILVSENISVTGRDLSLKDQIAELLPGTSGYERLMNFMERQEVPADYTLMKQGDPPDDLYFIESGQVSVLLQLEGGAKMRIRKMGGGTVVGEMGLYLNIPRSASVVTEKPSVVYRMTAEQLRMMEITDPPAAAAFHMFMARLLAERLNHTDKTLRAVME